MSEFSSQGFESFPNLYADEKRLSEIAAIYKDGSYVFTTERLEELVMHYGQFLSKPQMPRATATANRILEHLIFELGYRDGVYGEFTGKQEDELCQND